MFLVADMEVSLQLGQDCCYFWEVAVVESRIRLVVQSEGLDAETPSVYLIGGGL